MVDVHPSVMDAKIWHEYEQCQYRVWPDSIRYVAVFNIVSDSTLFNMVSDLAIFTIVSDLIISDADVWYDTG